MLGEAVYRHLLRHPGHIADQLAADIGMPVEPIQKALDELQNLGFATHSPEQKNRLFATPPEIAVEALLRHRESELRSARHAIPELLKDAQSADQQTGARVVELVASDAAAKMQPYLQVHRTAEQEVRCLVRPPFLVSSSDAYEDSRLQARTRGVRYRDIVHPDVLSLPGWPEMLRTATEAGEEIRLLSYVPFKINVADRHYAVMPLSVDDPQGPMLLLRGSLLLDALIELFEAYWEQAAPLQFAPDGSIATPARQAHFPRDLEPLITLLASGVNDKSIGDHLGMSKRTLVRRMDRLYRTLHARSRFQAGWQAALRAAAMNPELIPQMIRVASDSSDLPLALEDGEDGEDGTLE